MHSTAKIFGIVKYLKTKKIQKLKKKKKKERIGKMAQKGPKRQKGKIFFSRDQSSKKNEKK